MPDNLFNLNKLKSLISNFFRSMVSFVDGYEVSDGRVESKSGQVTSFVTLEPKVGGNRTDLDIYLTATNIDTVFDNAVDCIKNLSMDKIQKDANYRSEFLGLTGINLQEDPETHTYNYNENYPGNNISLAAIQANGKGLLGIDIIKAQDDQLEEWKEYAMDNLKYDLLCETAQDDAGTVKNQDLMSCVSWIHKYIDILNKNHPVGENKQLTTQEKAERAEDKEAQISSKDPKQALILAKPILLEIQGQLRDMYQDKLNTENSIDPLLDTDAEAEVPEENESEATQSEGSENPENSEGDTMNPNSQYADDADIVESKHIDITLKKITASDELAIISLDSNYLPGDTLNDVDEIINQNDFLNVLTEEPQTFAISVDDEGFDIEPCEECKQCDPCASLCEVFKSGIRAYRNLYIIHWMSKGNDMMKLHIMAEELYGELIQEIDTIGELLVEKCGTIPQPDWCCDYLQVKPYEFQESLDILKKFIQEYIDCIDYAYPNQTSDVQSTLDEWLRYWNKQMNYFIKNQEE